MHKTSWSDTSWHLPDITHPSAWHGSLRNGCRFCPVLPPLLSTGLSAVCPYIHQAPPPLVGSLGISPWAPVAHQLAVLLPLRCCIAEVLVEECRRNVSLHLGSLPSFRRTAKQECLCLDVSHFLRKHIFRFFTFSLLCFHNPVNGS